MKMKSKIINIFEKIGNISIFIFALSLFNSKGVQNISFGLGILCFLILFILNKESLDFGDKKLRIAILTMTVGLVIFTSFSDVGLISSKKVISRYYKYLMFFPLCSFIKTKKDLKIFICIALISLLSSHFLGVKQFLEATNKNQRFGVFFDLIGYANILSVGAIFLLSFFLFHKVKWMWKMSYLLLYFISIFLIVITKTRGAYITIIFVSLFLLVLKSKKNLIIGLGILVALYFTMPQQYINRIKTIKTIEKNNSNNLRIMFWKASIYTYIQNPIFGAGNKGCEKFYEEYYKKIGKYEEIKKKYPGKLGNAHSTYFAWLSRYGLMLLFLIYFKFKLIPEKLYSLYKGELDTFDKAMLYSLMGGFLCFYIAGLTENQLSKQVTGYFFATLVSLLSIMNRVVKNKKIKQLG